MFCILYYTLTLITPAASVALLIFDSSLTCSLACPLATAWTSALTFALTSALTFF